MASFTEADAGILLDSSFLIGFHNSRDVHHDRALVVMPEFLAGGWGRGMLLEYVFLEVVTVLALRRSVETAARVGSLLLEARELEFLPCSTVFLEAFETFRSQGASRLSLTDAALVSVARKRRIRNVATFDRDFRGLDGIDVVGAD